MKDSKKMSTEGLWNWQVLSITHSTPQNLTSNELTVGKKKREILTTIRWDMFLTLFTSPAELSGWRTHEAFDRQKKK